MWCIRLIRWIGRQLLKVLLLPVLLITFAVQLLAKLTYNIGAFGLTPLLLLYLYAFVYIITHQQYEQLIIVAIAVVGTLGIAFAAAFLVVVLEDITDHMMHFMWT